MSVFQWLLAFRLVASALCSCDEKAGCWKSANVRVLAGRHDMMKYHTATEILSAVSQLTQSCQHPLHVATVNDSKRVGGLLVARLGKSSSDKKVMVVANEHPRELVTAEVMLRFLQMACNGSGDLQELEFVLVPVVNEQGRRLVETGSNVCQRLTTEEEGAVDLNRNMDVDWGRGVATNPGLTPFSTYQTRILRDLAAELQPLAFVDIHSGRRELITSWGYQHTENPDFGAQREPLDLIKAQHCPDCVIGAGWETIGYESPGEIIDHMYLKQGIKHATLWEIYEDSDHEGDCVLFFNPTDTAYDEVVSNWTAALFAYGRFVAQRVRVGDRSSAWLHRQGSQMIRAVVKPHGEIGN